MANSEVPMDEITPIQPLVYRAAPLETAAETMLAASRNMLAAASAWSAGLGAAGAREQEAIAEAIEVGFVRALRRDTLLGGAEYSIAGGSLLSLPSGRGIPGTGYGRTGASITGSGRRAQLYGTIGGAIGYAVGGPVGALLGGMLGGLLGGDDRRVEQPVRRQEELGRQWLNTPEGFEIEAYLYNLARAYRATGLLFSSGTGGGWRSPWLDLSFLPSKAASVVVNFPAGAVQIVGQGEEAGERAARAFAGALGRVLQLNSVVVPAAGFGGDV